MNKQSNSYTVLYIIILVVVVGAALAIASLALKPRQNENIKADKMAQILAAIHKPDPDQDVIAAFDKFITRQLVVNENGDSIGNDAFNIDVKNEVKADPAARQLPVYIATLDDGSSKLILPVYGAGLWGPIWGYIALNDDCASVYGAYFSHESETPGLGAEIAKPDFSNKFVGKYIVKDNRFLSIAVVKAGQKPPCDDQDYVDGISGGTITSKGVSAMLETCLKPYEKYLNKVRKN